MNVIQYEPGMTIKPGMVIAGMPNSVYHSSPGISKSGLDLVARSPAHFRYRAPREATRAMEIGTAIHTALLEPERFHDEYLLLRDVKDRRASAYKEAVKATGTSELVLVGHEADKVSGMQAVVHSNTTARGHLLHNGWTEMSVYAEDPLTGTLCKCRFDSLSRDLIACDVKKTRDARPDDFSRSVFNYRYHVQDAFYSDVFEWATGEPLKAFVFLAVEEELPHAVKVYELDTTARNEGRERYRENLDVYAGCEADGDWPSLSCDQVETIGLPEWKVRQIENELEDGGII